jgi:RHS repeat-associated protein
MFNAKELDEESGMYYYEARYYAPPTFISRDPLFEEKPWLNPYHYCSNNPVKRIDPTGLTDYDVEIKGEKTRKTIKDGHENISVNVSNREFKKLDRKHGRENGSYEKYRNKIINKNGSTATNLHNDANKNENILNSFEITFNRPKEPNNMSFQPRLKGGSIDGTVALGPIGYTLEVGYITDDYGNGSWFFNHGWTAGFEASASLNAIFITTPDFRLDYFEGNSASLNISTPYVISGSIISDHSRGAIKDYYFNNYGGFKLGAGVGAGCSLSHTKTILF